jgi:dimethylamine/trimethylamine dehydrogenase
MPDTQRWDYEPSFSHDELRAAAPERYAPLFEPMRIGPKTAPNRFYTVPYSTGWDNHLIRREVGHRRMRAVGGWGVVTTGEALFAREAITGALPGLELFDDDDVKCVATIPDAIHEHGALAGIELVHYGGLANPTLWRVPPVAPSQIQGEAMFFSGAIAQTMTLDEIRHCQEQWALAAKRARTAGFDIVYVHCAHSGQPMQFLAPYYNERTDQYGGELVNRARFLREILERIREAIGDDTAIACRYGIEALGTGGLPIDEALEVMAMVDHLVDLWDIAIGGLANADRDLTPSRLYEEGASLQWSRRAKEVTSKPVVGSGRFTDVDLMLRVLESGELDFIGAARPGIADPFLPRKIAAGEFGAIRECIGSNRCAFSQFQGNMGCSQNATTGEEYRRGWNPEQFSRAANAHLPVLIVGAGPAGMECATVLARRGFQQIHLVDERRRMGGHMRWFSGLPRFNPWGRIIEHREWLISRFGSILFVPGKRLDSDAVLDYGASIVIVATGAPWAREAISVFDHTAIPGATASLAHVLTPEQLLLEDKAVPGRRVVVYDCEAELTALAVCQALQAREHVVELASPFPDIGFRAHQDGVSFALRGEILEAGGSLRPGLTLTAVDENGADFVDTAMQEARIECDAVMLITRRKSDDQLFFELDGRRDDRHSADISALYRIGDCVAPQNLSEAIFSGHRLAREIDERDPAVPLPALRA